MTANARTIWLHRPASADQPPTLRVEEAVVADPGPGQVRVDVTVALLDPRDAARTDLPVPRTLASEAVGVVAQVGPGVVDWYVGDRVALPASLPCGRCGACLAGRTTLCAAAGRPGADAPGWLADQVLAPADLLHHVPAQLTDAEAASVPGVVATAYHALKRGGVGPDVTVVVLGADPLGLQLTQLATLAGGTVVTVAPHSSARETALELGADAVLDPDEGDLGERLRERLGDGADRVFLTPTAHATVAEAVALLRAGGRAVVVAEAAEDHATVAVEPLVAGELDIVGARGATTQDVAELFDLAADDRLVLSATVGDEATIDDPERLARALVEGSGDGRLAITL